MKLEVGMYVRTKIGVIGKIISIDKDSHNNNIITIFNGHFHIIHNETRTEFDITKASHNIIDLIEVGDYVNGFRVDEIGEYHSIKTDKVETYAKVNCSALLNCFYEEDIKSIVTKEQFESMSYKVKE